MKVEIKSVQVIDHAATGAAFRVVRIKRKLSLREAGKRIGVSAPYLSDLERGLRTWTAEKLSRFETALRKKA